MNRWLSGFMIVLMAAGLMLAACGGEASTANIKSATLAKDEAGTQPTTTFESDETFYLVVDLANAPDDTTVKTVWYTGDVGSVAAPNTLIDEASVTAGSGQLFFNLAPSGLWAPGTYKAEIYLNDELNRTLDIRVNGEVVQAAQPEPTDEPAAAPVSTEPAASADGAVDNLQDVRQATIRIQAQGSFVDPEFGEMTNSAGQGTGFIIDESGIAVTNNHVVTGAAFLQVYLDGEDSPRNARILGVSECSDLAVIDIDGDGLPYLQWHEGDSPVGMDIYVAGYPFYGNEEYTLTRGIISKARVVGETDWASVDNVLEVDAVINPGNSGGPLVNSEGRVVGVNYASNAGTSQYYSISRTDALPIINQMREGEDVHSLGINGRAVTDGESIYGIWVSSVESGSPADKAGIKPADIVTKLEGLVLATDGTMADYCDILRGHDAEDTLSVEVLRLSTGELLEGQVNGEPLAVVGTFGDNTGGDDGAAENTTTGGDDTGGATGETYSEFVSVRDDTSLLQISIPAEWSDINGEGWFMDGENMGPGLLASPDIEGYQNTWTTPGMFFGASSSLIEEYDYTGFLDGFDFTQDCAYDGRFDYSDELYTGAYDVYSNCGGEGTTFVVLAAEPENRNALIVLQAQLVSDADGAAFQRMLESFVYFVP